MKTYSAKTNALAADAVLTAAVEQAAGLLRNARVVFDVGRSPYGMTISYVGVYGRELRITRARVGAHEILLAAGRSAELLLDRAQLATLPEVDA